MSEKNPNQEEAEYPYWRRVYLTVIVWTAVLIFVLWLITRQFN